jgi:hypothetical protein
MNSALRSLPIGLLAATTLAHGQADPAAIQKIVEEGKNRSQVMKHLYEITHKIGPRLTGSPQLSKAEEWAMRKFREYGCTNVHLDKWGDIPVGFERGKRQIGRMVSPFESDFQFTTMNWTPGTDGLVRAEVVFAPKTMDEFNAQKDNLKGKWLLSTRAASMRGPQRDPAALALDKAISESGIHGRIFGARDERVHSSGNWRDKSYEKRPTDVEIIVRKSDFDRMSRNIEFGRKPVVEFDIENRWIKGPLPQYNVVADLKGTEKPDEMVIICGHLDSWNSPGSQGTSDNATGVVTAIEAARILHKAGIKPKRTIRFILWGGEEQGLLGSRAYVQKHKDTLGKISAVLNDDGGTNYQGGYTGIATMKAMMEEAFAPTVAAFPDLPMQFVTVPNMPASGSSDHAPFNWEGVPGFFTIERGRADYGFVWHTQNDRFEYAIPEYLVQSSTNHALVSYYLANAPTLLPRGPKPPPRTTRLNLDHDEAVGSDHMYEDPSAHMKANHDHEDDYILEFRHRLRWMYRTFTSSVAQR